MLIGELRRKLGNCYSLSHLRRLAHLGGIPGAKLKTGGKFRFRQSPKLEIWITRTIEARARQKNRRSFRDSANAGTRVEANDKGVATLLEKAHQFRRDYFSYSREKPQRYLDAVLEILGPVLNDIKLGQGIRAGEIPSARLQTSE